MSEQLDLLGEPLLRRSAVFDGTNRLELLRTWGPGPIACVIGHNPSNAGDDRDDPTSRWWIDWFTLFGFGGYVAVNLYPFVTSEPRECARRNAEIYAGNAWHDRDALHFINLPTVVRVAKSAHQVFACWGAIAGHDHGWIEHVIEEIQSGEEPYPDLWC